MSLPHVVVWTQGAGLGCDLVAALNTHPISVSDVRGLNEARRAASGPPVMLVALVSPLDIRVLVAEAMLLFPDASILVVADASPEESLNDVPSDTRITRIPTALSLEMLCWHVAEALSHARSQNTPSRNIGPILLEVDRQGVVAPSCELGGNWFFLGRSPLPGQSLLPLIAPDDCAAFAQYLERTATHAATFFPVRILDANGTTHPMLAGLTAGGTGQVKLILQPLIDVARIVGHRVSTRDPFTGLIDRWELWRLIEKDDPRSRPTFVLHARLDTFASAVTDLSCSQVDELFERVASAITQVFPWPSLPSRLSGGGFLLLIKDMPATRVKALGERLIRMVSRIRVSTVHDSRPFGLSCGVARVTGGDHDLSVRLAEAAAREAKAAGGSRLVIARSQKFTHSRRGDFSASMEPDSWDVWLQPVVRPGDRLPSFYEALARFGSGTALKVSRSEFFTTGEAAGLLERFDRLVISRSIDLLAAHPDLRLSVNVTRETFQLDSFPDFFLRSLDMAKVDASRVLIEISPACLTLPLGLVHARLGCLHAGGVAIALDDFGSGLCSLRHLTDFPLAMVKLDGIVTGYVADDPLQRNFVRMVVNLCRARGIQTVAEYIRTNHQMEQLVADGIDLFQGELFGMPVPATDCLNTLPLVPPSS